MLITSGTQGWEKQPPFFPSQSLHFNGHFMGLVSVEGVLGSTTLGMYQKDTVKAQGRKRFSVV